VRVVWTETALRGVWRAYDYLMDFNPRAAVHLAESLLAAGDSLENFPHRGRPVRGTSLRELVTVSPYIIRYRVTSDTVIILRVRHTARRPTRP
jgi:toxin ParE1/3/4